MKANVIIKGNDYNQFPKLFKHKGTDAIVLFVSKKEGFTLTESSSCKIGYHSTNWVSCDDDTVWEPLSNVTIEFTE